jgi:hypothetical protein
MTVGGECSGTAMLGGELTMNTIADCFAAASTDAMLTCVVRT